MQLALAGYELVLYNRTRSKAEELAAEVGAKVAEIPKEVASSSGVIFTMLPGPPEVEEVVAGEDGLLEEPGKELSDHRHEHILARPGAGAGPYRPQAGSRDARRPGERGRRGG